MKHLTITFEEPFIVDTQGGEVTVCNMNLTAPTARCASYCAILKGQYSKAQMASISLIDKIPESAKSEKKESEEDSKITGDAVIELMGMGGSDLSKCFHALQELFKKTNATFNDGEHRATSDFTEMIPYTELQYILGEYIANFILTSGPKRKS